jgi:basic membrane protein A
MAAKFLCAIALALFFVGCGTREKTQQKEPESQKETRSFSVVMMIAESGQGGVAGISEGIERVSKELGAETRMVTVPESEYERRIGEIADENPSLVICLGSEGSNPLIGVTARNPHQKFAVIDEASAEDNVLGVRFKLEQGGLLAGIVAGMTTKSKKIGLLIGRRQSNAIRIESGFRAGISTSNSGATLTTLQATRDNGRQMAQSLFDSGVDIVFCSVPEILEDVVAIAKSQRGFVIALGADHDADEPGVVLTSVVKNGEKAIIEAARMAKEGTFQARTLELGIKDSYISLSEPKEFTKLLLHKRALDAVDEARKMILDGALIVPRTNEELAKFTPPRLAALL